MMRWSKHELTRKERWHKFYAYLPSICDKCGGKFWIESGLKRVRRGDLSMYDRWELVHPECAVTGVTVCEKGRIHV